MGARAVFAGPAPALALERDIVVVTIVVDGGIAGGTGRRVGCSGRSVGRPARLAVPAGWPPGRGGTAATRARVAGRLRRRRQLVVARAPKASTPIGAAAVEEL